MTSELERRFVQDVGRHLGDLPAEHRADLIAELEQHVAEAGTPEISPREYAAELRRAAGFPPRRRMRPRLVALAAVVVLVVVVSTTGFVWARRYQPLHFGGGCFLSSPFGEDISVGISRERRLVYDDGKAVRVVWTLSSQGSRTVTVSNLAFPTAQWGVGNISVGIGPGYNRGGCVSPAETHPFESFDLAPDERSNIVLTGRFAGCKYYAPGDAAGIETVHATVSTFGVRHGTDLRLYPALSIRFPATMQCAGAA